MLSSYKLLYRRNTKPEGLGVWQSQLSHRPTNLKIADANSNVYIQYPQKRTNIHFPQRNVAPKVQWTNKEPKIFFTKKGLSENIRTRHGKSETLLHFEVPIPKRRDGRQETEVKMKSLDLFETKAKPKLTLYQCVDERTDSILCNQYNRKLVPKTYLREKPF